MSTEELSDLLARRGPAGFNELQRITGMPKTTLWRRLIDGLDAALVRRCGDIWSAV